MPIIEDGPLEGREWVEFKQLGKGKPFRFHGGESGTLSPVWYKLDKETAMRGSKRQWASPMAVCFPE